MKRIKGFNLFENVSDINSLISCVNDICLELNDIDIYTECSYIPDGGNKAKENCISLMIHSELSETVIRLESISWKLVKDTVLSVLDYMDSNGWKLSYMAIDGNRHYADKLDFQDNFLTIKTDNTNLKRFRFRSLEFNFIQF